MTSPRQLGGALLASLLVGCGAARASDKPLEPVPGERVADAQLAEQRAGFSWQGLNVNFGAEMRSYIGDQLVVRTNVNWATEGGDVQRTISSTLASATAADLRAVAAASSLPALDAQQRVVVQGNGGQTTFLQRTDGVIQNILLNTASNVDLRQNVDLKLDIANFTPFLSGILASRVGSALSNMSGLVSIRGALR